MAAEGLLIFDNNSSSFQYSGEGWTTRYTSSSDPVQWYGGSATYYSSAPVSPSQTGSFSFTFEGTEAALHGMISTISLASSFSVAIDGGSSSNVRYNGDRNLPSLTQWYQTPMLKDGPHNISISNLEGLVLDYAVVTAGPKTHTSGKRVVVDDDSQQLDYQGKWVRNTGSIVSSNPSRSMPFRNVTHQAWTVGDSFSLTFVGTSVDVHGVFSWSTLGEFSVDLTLDGITSTATYSVTDSSPGYLNNLGDVFNFPYFAQDYLPAGQHTLLGNITHVTNKTFILDYITYTPSFDTFPVGLLPTTSLTTPAATMSDHKPSSSSPSNTANRREGSNQTKSLGMILGITLGTIAFCAVLLSLLLFMIKRRKSLRRDRHERQNSGDTLQPLMTERTGTPVHPSWSASLSRPSSDTTIITPFPDISTVAHLSVQSISASPSIQDQRTRPPLPRIITSGPFLASQSRVHSQQAASSRPLTPLRRPMLEPIRTASSLPAVFIGTTWNSSHHSLNIGIHDPVQSRFSTPIQPHRSDVRLAATQSTIDFPRRTSSEPFSDASPFLSSANSRPIHPDMRSDCGPRNRDSEQSIPQVPLVLARSPFQQSSVRRLPPPVLNLTSSSPLRPTIDGNEHLPESPGGVQRRRPGSSPLGALIPRLTSILRPGTSSRQSSGDRFLDVNDEGNPPPAYHTISARQSRLLVPRSSSAEIFP